MTAGATAQALVAAEHIAVTTTYIGGTADNSSKTVYTFTNHAIGGPGLIVVGFQKEGGTFDIASATIGGNAARINAQPAATNLFAAILSARVASGTTATIVVTLNGAATRAQVNVWRLQNVISDIEHDDIATIATATVVSGTIDTVAGGALVACMAGNDPTFAVTWAGVTEQYDANIGGGNTRASGGHSDTATATSGLTVSATGTSDDRALAAASFR